MFLNESWIYGKHQLKEGFADINSLYISIECGEYDLFYQGSERDEITGEIFAIWNSGNYQVSEAVEEWLLNF